MRYCNLWPNRDFHDNIIKYSIAAIWVDQPKMIIQGLFRLLKFCGRTVKNFETSPFRKQMSICSEWNITTQKNQHSTIELLSMHYCLNIHSIH